MCWRDWSFLRPLTFPRAWIALWAWLFCATAWAVPHTVTPVDHAYDPDWPDVYLILENKCVACHRPKCDRVDLSSHQSVIHGMLEKDPSMKIVVPGKPDESVLWEYVAWNVNARASSDLPDTPMMPPSKDVEWLTAGELETIFRWIKGGALQYKLPQTCNIRPLMEIDFPSAKQCKVCHPKQFTEWSRSMHAYSQHSPIFEAFNLTLVERTAGTIGTFCSRCHTPIGTALGENESVRNIHRSRTSMEGVTCIVCHRRKSGHYKSSGRVVFQPGGLMDGCMYGPFETATSAEAGSHKSSNFPYIKSSQFCGECHDVTSPTGLRLEEAYSEWVNSHAAKKGITCQMCHMGPVQGTAIPDSHRPMGYVAVVPGMPKHKLKLRPLSNHTFAGPDYSMLPDTEFPLKRDWMYEVDYRNPVNLTPYQQKSLRNLRRENQEQLRISTAKRLELLSSAARLRVQIPAWAQAAGNATIRVDVQSILSGHSFPTGFTAERQLWVHVQVVDPFQRVIFESGDLDHNQDLRDDHSHEVLSGKTKYDKHLLNFQNKFTTQVHRGSERSVVLSVNRDLQPVNVLRPATGISSSFGRPFSFRIAKGSLAPLTAQGQDYPVDFPNYPGYYKVYVALKFRHLPPTLLDHIGTPHLKHLLEVVTLDTFDGTICVKP